MLRGCSQHVAQLELQQGRIRWNYVLTQSTLEAIIDPRVRVSVRVRVMIGGVHVQALLELCVVNNQVRLMRRIGVGSGSAEPGLSVREVG